jgi:hypothetical protein
MERICERINERYGSESAIVAAARQRSINERSIAGGRRSRSWRAVAKEIWLVADVRNMFWTAAHDDHKALRGLLRDDVTPYGTV